MTKGSKVRFKGLPKNADCNIVALYGRLEKDKTYEVLAAVGDANIARGDGLLGAVILDESAIILKTEDGTLHQFSLNSGLFTVVSKVAPSAVVLSWSKCRGMRNPIIKPRHREDVETAVSSEYSFADALLDF